MIANDLKIDSLPIATGLMGTKQEIPAFAGSKHEKNRTYRHCSKRH